MHKLSCAHSTLGDKPSGAVIVDAGFDGKLSKRHCFAVVFNQMNAPRIGRLFNACGPSAIAGFVIACIVNAVYRVKFAWAATHVKEKGFKIGSPAFANGNAATAPQMKLSMSRIGAPFNHSGPNAIFGGLGFAVTNTMDASGLLFPAPAGFCSAAPQVGWVNSHFVSAIAKRKVSWIFAFAVNAWLCLVNNQKAVKSLSNHASHDNTKHTV